MNDLDQERLLYPRVSDIIGKQTEQERRSIPLDVLANACIRGTKVHDYCAASLKSLWLPEVEPEYKPYLDAFTIWAEENIYQTLYSNIRLYEDQKKFSGEYDAIVVLKHSKQIALIDIKTSSVASKSWPIQLAAYKHLCEINGYEIETVLNLHLKKSRAAVFDTEKNMITPPVVKANQISYVNIIPYWEIFSSALACYNYFDRKEVTHV